jgi:hypothetical protein
MTVRFRITWLMLVRTEPPLQVKALGCLFKLNFWRLTISIPKRCHMDLWLDRHVFTYHNLHRHHQLPSATLPGDRVSSAFLLVVFLFMFRATVYSIRFLLLLSVFCLSFIRFCSVLFNLLLFDYSVFGYSIIQYYFLFWNWNCILGISYFS